MIPTLVGGIASQLVFNDASGGTITTFTSGGRNFRRHTFLSNGTFTVSRSVKPFTVAVLGGGGAGGVPADGFQGNAGSAGGWHAGTATLPVSALSVTIGAGGVGGGNVSIGGAPGFAGQAGGNTTLQGSFVGGGGFGGGANGVPAAPNTAPGTGNPSPSADGGVTTPDRATYGIASDRGTGGGPATGTYLNPTSPSGSGTAGALVIQYEIP
jgi:hypothetical protein